MGSISLDKKLIGDIEGDFIVPAYQRGFRWDQEVEKLLDDIDKIPDGKKYCFQPIVVKNIGKPGENKYELIDGQQRLTSVYLLIRYIIQLGFPYYHNFSIYYETRDNSKEFLEKINIDILDNEINNIDEYFFVAAYKKINSWFEKQKNIPYTASRLYEKLCDSIFAIWYEVDPNEKSVPLFRRLNRRILLTNAELVKALFLSQNSEIDHKKQLEIATEWDNIEKELHDNSFWRFITNEDPNKYQVRIEILFNLYSGKRQDEKNVFFTFDYFDNELKGKNNKSETWTKIKSYFQRLQEWYKIHDLYHKIGYLIASNYSLSDLINNSDGVPKHEFHDSLDSLIAKSINTEKCYNELSYRSESDYILIKKILLLFNVETVRQKAEETMRFPFCKYKDENWSLEHIHAQESEGLNKKELWVEWLNLHKKILETIDKEKNKILIKEITDAENDKNINNITFLNLYNKIINELSKDNSKEYNHSISNLALLGKSNNSVLNNSVFAVKRNKILEIDKKGDYIPECTRCVFLKYYTRSEDNQLHFWGEPDRNGYLNEMNTVLSKYLKIINKEILP